MAIEKKYINFSEIDNNANVTTKLYSDVFNKTELEKSVDTLVTELIKPLPDRNLDLIPKPIYDAEVTRSLELEKEIIDLQNEIDDLTSQVQLLTADSASLYISNDNLLVTNARLENSLTSTQQTQLELRQNLTTSLTKAINEATERTALEAENSGLTAQKNALIKQIDTLNNLLAQANASLAVAQQQLSAKAQAVAAGGVSTGELATILWEKGDPAKNGSNGYAYSVDLNQGGQKVWRPAGGAQGWSSNYVDIIAGPKDVDVEIKQTFFLIPNKFKLKANQTQRFKFDKPNVYAVPSPANKNLKNAALATSAIAAITTGFIAAGGISAAAAGASFAAAALAAGITGVGSLSATAGAIGALGGPVGLAVAGIVIIGAAIFGATRPKYKKYEETLTFVIKDVDPNGKTEDKTFKGAVHSYDK
jgi:hypothetical protein